MKLPRRAIVLLSVLLVACPKSEESKSDDKSSEKKKDKKDDKKDKKAEGDDDDDKGKKPKHKPKGDDDDDDKKAEKPAKKDPPVADPVIERTKTPTVAEWNAASDAKANGNDVGCEVRTVREWVRVSCRKKSPTGGEPTAVWVTRGKTKDTFLYVAKGVTSMITPLLPGTDLEAKYSWSDVVWSVEVRWQKGHQKPSDVADFDKTDDKPVESIVSTATCECFKSHYKKSKCSEDDSDWMITSINPWCEKTYAKECDKLMECSRGEPGRWPSCPKGFTNNGMGHWCVRLCEDGKCPAGTQCVDGEIAATGKKICEEKN